MNVFFAVILLILSAFMFFSAVLGQFRFKFTMNRMHAAALGDTLGLLSASVAVILLTGFSWTALKIILIPVFVFLTGPVVTHLIAKTEIEYGDEASGGYEKEEQ